VNQIKPGTSSAQYTLRNSIRSILRHSLYASSFLSAAVVLGGARAQAAPESAATASTATSNTLKEIIVTAESRRERIQDVPYNITAIDSKTMQQAGATTLNELTSVVPGLTTVSEGPGARGQVNNLTLRGLRVDSPGGGQATTETPNQTVDSVSTYWGQTPIFFPMPLYDVERVEVLRGPQGTLYGSGAEAGTIRLIPTPPQFDRFSGEVQAEGSAIENAAQPSNWNRALRGILNIPIGDKLAVRFVAGGEHDGGFISNNDLLLRNGQGGYAVPVPSIPGDLTSGPIIAPESKDTNTANQWFARGALRWKPSEAFQLQVEYLHQYINSANTQYSNPGYPGGLFNLTTPDAAEPPGPNNPAYWPNSNFTMKPGGTYTSTAFVLSPYTDVTNLVDAVATVDLGFASVTSASSYYNDTEVGVSDWTGLFNNPTTFNYDLFFPYNHYPREIADAYVPASTHSFVQELRLVSKRGHFFDYVLGLYYNRQPDSQGWMQIVPGIDAYETYIGQPNPSQYGDLIWNYKRNSTFVDRAVYGQLTAHVTSKWQITGGVRYFAQSFWNNYSSALVFCGAVCASDGTNPNGVTAGADSLAVHRHIWMANSSYNFTPDLKAYATYSEGFRRGGANAVSTGGVYASIAKYETFVPDFTRNYEVGIKGDAFHHRVRYTADVYLVNWDHFQFNAVNLSGLPVTYNGSTARSQGAEFELQAAITSRTQLTLGYAYTDAKVTRTFELFDYPSYAIIPAFGGNGQTAPLFGGPIESGTRLPGVARNSFTFGVDHTFPVPFGSSATLTLHIDGSYRSSESAYLVASSPYNWKIPSAFMGNVRATLEPGGPVGYSFFIENFTSCACYSGGTNVQGYPNFARFRFVSRPRTYGVNITYKF
jgi:iron complex outermembrane receptor protein